MRLHGQRNHGSRLAQAVQKEAASLQDDQVTRSAGGRARPPAGRACAKAVTSAASSSSRGSGWAPSGLVSPWECRADESHQARPEEAKEPSWGTAQGTL
eukprot:scaffold128929_cov57-Phaeocystis_antarctica.AAC.1